MFFVMVDVNKTTTDFRQLASEIECLVVAPRIGAVVDHSIFKGEVHVGAMYQKASQQIEVIVPTEDLGELDVVVRQFEPKKWSYLIGGLWGIDERLHLLFEYGFGGREYCITGLTVRS